MNLIVSRTSLSIVWLYFCCLSTVLCYYRSGACYDRCACTNDVTNERRTIVHCKWPSVSSGWLLNISRSSTSSLIIECTKNDEVSVFDDQMFANFTNLSSLRIENCRIQSLSSTIFAGLQNLRLLYLVNLHLQDTHSQLADGVFDHLKHLQWLHIVGCNIRRFSERCLCQTKSLQVLNVSNNALTTIKDVIRTPNCSAADLIILDLSKNDISALTSDDLKPFTAIRKLFLGNNRIASITNKTFGATKYLQYLSLQNNNINNIGYLPDSLMELNIANNQLSSVPQSVYTLQNLQYLNLSYNEISITTQQQLNCSRLQILDLSHNNLADFPDNFVGSVSNSLAEFFVAFNHIKRLSNGSLSKFIALEKLDLSNNLFKDITATVFNISKLNYLNLSHNYLETVSTEVIPETSSLLNLDLSYNQLQQIPPAVEKLIILQVLNMSHNKIKNISKSIFNDLASLQRIDLSYNSITQIQSGIFKDSRSLKQLLLSNNVIMSLAEDAFDKCEQLEHLDLSNNRIEGLNNSLSAINSLITANFTDNRLTVLEWKGLPSRLISLDASNNQISNLTSSDGSKIRFIKLKDNKLRALSATEIPDSVESLDVSNNLIENVSPEVFVNKTNLRMVNFRSNKIQNISKAVFGRKIAYDLYIADNPLKCNCEMLWLYKNNKKALLRISDKNEAKCTHVFEKYAISLADVKEEQLLCSYKQFCGFECPCCDYSICYCHSLCPAGCQCYRNFNASTNIVHCKALNSEDRSIFDIRQQIPNQATHIYFEQMNFTVLARHSFLGLAMLQQLHINASGIETIEKQAFKSLQSLKLLDLSDNELSEFTGDEFNEEAEISHLFLNNNHLTKLPMKLLKKFPKLQYLTLHENRFQELPEAVEKYGELLTKVSLAKNPFRCDCGDRFKIQDWILENSGRVVDKINLECVENITEAFLQNDTTILSNRVPNWGTDMFVMNMLEFIKDANRSLCSPEADGIFSIEETTNYMLILIAILVPGFFVVALVVLGRLIVQKTHDAMAQRRYKCPPSLNCSQITPGSSPVPLIHFDAFVSYAKKDEKLVIDGFCRQLEYEEYLLCLLHRDGPVYNIKLHSVSDELINQMECSKALILVLTQNFLDGEWKTLQIKTSHRLFAKSRGKKLIALLGDGIEPNQLDAELGQILRKNTCFRMNDPLFWNLLHSALPERITPSNCSADSSQIYSDCYGTIVPSDIV
uniref:TIR domain-containing protein n=1 Tax=Syphacia muris TaxID=451379 RepID=A0A0N5A8T2_9BILA